MHYEMCFIKAQFEGTDNELFMNFLRNSISSEKLQMHNAMCFIKAQFGVGALAMKPRVTDISLIDGNW